MKKGALILALSVTAACVFSSCGANVGTGESNTAGAQINAASSSGLGHTHQLAVEPNTVSEPISGYCGNTLTTVYCNGKKYSFCYDDSVTLTDILINMEYDKDKVCDCETEYGVDTEFGDGYSLNLTQGFARCDNGQADLTEEQLEKVKEVMNKLGSECKPE